MDINSTITIEQVLRAKGHDYFAMRPNATAYEALESMAEQDIGALLVVDDGMLAGVFSERDYVRKVIVGGKSTGSTTGKLMSFPPSLGDIVKKVVSEQDSVIQTLDNYFTSNDVRARPYLS